MLNRNIILSVSEDISKWEGVIYPEIYRVQNTDSLGNPINSYTWVCNYGNYPNGANTGIFVENIELRCFHIDDSYDDWCVRFWFAASMPNPTLYVKRTDLNIVLSVPRDRQYRARFEDDNYKGFFSSNDAGKGIPMIFSSKPL